MDEIEALGLSIVLEHAYDPVKAREYYLRTRKLKGRKKAPKRIEEDEVPGKSPTGARLVDFDGKGSGKAIYSDGSVYDGNGWRSKKGGAAKRVGAARSNISRARELANKVSDPRKKKALLNRLDATEQKLISASRKRIAGRRVVGDI